MADNIVLKTWSGELNTPLHDAVVRDALTCMNGIYIGCNVTYVSGNSLHMSAGYGMIKGRLFEVYDTDLEVRMPSSGTYRGRIYVRMDLSNTDEPIEIIAYSGASLPDLEQDDNVNFDNGIFEMELATFTVTTREIQSIIETFETITGEFDKLTKADYMESPGLQSKSVNYSADGRTETQTFADGSVKTTTYSEDGMTMVEELVQNIGSGQTITTKTTVYNSSGYTETLNVEASRVGQAIVNVSEVGG